MTKSTAFALPRWDADDLLELAKSAMLFFCLVAIFMALFPSFSLAAGAGWNYAPGYIDPSNTPAPGTSAPTTGGTIDPVTLVFLKVVHHAVGFSGKAICTLAIIVAGIAALFGKISWGQGLVISAGVALVFGCVAMMNAIVGGNMGAVVTPATLTCSMPISSSVSSLAGWSPVPVAGLLYTPLNPACGMMTKLINTIQGELAAGIGTLFVLFLGLAALFGRVSWPQAAVLSAGIGLIFGATKIVNILWADPTDCNLQIGGILSAVTALGGSGGTGAVLNAILSGVTPEFVMCQFLMIMQGDAGRMMASLAVIIMGFLAMLGRISWQYAVVVMVGIACVFGSHEIMMILVPGASDAGCFNTTFAHTALGTLGPIEKVLCDIHRIIAGPVGKALASTAIIMLGFGAMLGKVSYHAALVVAIGIAITFGAPQIVMYLTLAIDVCALPLNTLIVPTAVGAGVCNFANTFFR